MRMTMNAMNCDLVGRAPVPLAQMQTIAACCRQGILTTVVLGPTMESVTSQDMGIPAGRVLTGLTPTIAR